MSSSNYSIYIGGSLLDDLSITKQIVVILAGSIIIAVLAQIEIPIWPVPITGQSFGVILLAMVLGRWRGLICIIAYLLEGAVGLPVFAGGTGSIMKFYGPTGGYLIGFAFAAYVSGWLSELNKENKVLQSLIAVSFGHIIILTCGLLWLSVVFQSENIFQLGLIPFIPGAIVKTLMLTFFLHGILYFRRKSSK